MGRRRNSDTDLVLGLIAAPFAITGAIMKDAERNARIAEREARRNAKIAERREKLEQKQRILDAKIKAMESIFDNINKLYPRIKYCFESLKKSYITNPVEVEDLIYLIDEFDLTETIGYISYGQRVEAIRHLVENTNYSYNEIVQIILSIEHNLSDLLEYDEKARFEKGLGRYEFEPIENLLDIEKETDDYTAHTDITIECHPINYKEYISGKNTDIVKKQGH